MHTVIFRWEKGFSQKARKNKLLLINDIVKDEFASMDKNGHVIKDAHIRLFGLWRFVPVPQLKPTFFFLFVNPLCLANLKNLNVYTLSF